MEDSRHVEAVNRGKNFWWSEETRWFFMEVADEFEARPDVKVVLKRTGKMRVSTLIHVRRKGNGFAVVAFGDGIAVRLGDEDKERALRVPGARELDWSDNLALRKMISLPWSAREHWREYIHAAVHDGPHQAS